MPIFLIERRFAEQIEASVEGADAIRQANDQEGVRWLYSFLSADLRKSFCIYEAPSAEALVAAAARVGLPADVVTEVSGRLEPSGVVVDAAT